MHPPSDSKATNRRRRYMGQKKPAQVWMHRHSIFSRQLKYSEPGRMLRRSRKTFPTKYLTTSLLLVKQSTGMLMKKKTISIPGVDRYYSTVIIRKVRGTGGTGRYRYNNGDDVVSKLILQGAHLVGRRRSWEEREISRFGSVHFFL